MKVAIAQLNTVVGDIRGNLAKLQRVLDDVGAEGPDLVIFPELFVTGYPPVDILERSWFIEKVEAAVEDVRRLSREHPRVGIIVGAPLPLGGAGGRGLYNAALLIQDGRVLLEQKKALLPTYDVFDEARYFDPAATVDVIEFGAERLGISICEDAWNEPSSLTERCYTFDPMDVLVRGGATVLINISASPFYVGKERERYDVIAGHALKAGAPFVYVNLVGGNDELVFDGNSMVLDGSGNPIDLLPPFRECVRVVDLAGAGRIAPPAFQSRAQSLHDALVLGVRDYMGKCGFPKAVVGLSGGIDSAVVCALASEALGPGNILGISMPSPYSSPGSVDDSRALARDLGADFQVIPITEAFNSLRGSIRETFGKHDPDVAEENLQARIRGNILMTVSNRYGRLVLTTGNKSELAVGYCTLYGDMSGGLSVISDVPKTMVYELARFINRDGVVIPREIIDKPPSAELRPDQTDQDTLPPYDVLDDILHRYLEAGESVGRIVSAGHEEETVMWVVRAIHRSEYKRRQAAPGLKVTTKAFGRGRRMAVAAKYDV